MVPVTGGCSFLSMGCNLHLELAARPLSAQARGWVGAGEPVALFGFPSLLTPSFYGHPVAVPTL